MATEKLIAGLPKKEYQHQWHKENMSPIIRCVELRLNKEAKERREQAERMAKVFAYDEPNVLL